MLLAEILVGIIMILFLLKQIVRKIIRAFSKGTDSTKTVD